MPYDRPFNPLDVKDNVEFLSPKVYLNEQQYKQTFSKELEEFNYTDNFWFRIDESMGFCTTQ